MKNSILAFLLTLPTIIIILLLPIIIFFGALVVITGTVWFIIRIILDDLEGYEK